MESRVHSLDLRILAEDPEAGLESEATAFARRVLERTEEHLERAAPGRLFLLREMRTSWRLLRDGLRIEAETDAIAREIATWLEDRADVLLSSGGRLGGTAAEDEEMAFFLDEAAWRARHLEEIAAGRRPWWGERLDAEGRAPGLLARGTAGVPLTAVLARLARAGNLPAVLRGLPQDAIDAMVAAEDAIRDARIELEHAMATHRESVPDRPLPSWIDALFAALDARDGDARIALAIAAAVAAASTEPRRLADGDAGLVEQLHSRALAALRRERSAETPPRRDESGGDAPREAARLHERDAVSVASAWGGLVFLLRPLLELACAERLWYACLPEPPFLLRALHLLAGDEAADDPALALLAGAGEAGESLPDVAAELLPEISARILHELVEAIPRRGLASFPAAHVVRPSGADTLVAMPAGFPLPFFVWPGATPDEVLQGLELLLGVWPHTAPITAAPALVELDRRSRLRRARASQAPLGFVTPPPFSSAGWIATQVAGASGALFALRAGADLADVGRLRARHLRVPARLEMTRDEMRVVLPMERVDLDLRRAGLDRDPGWVPWLRRHVRIEFRESFDPA